MPTFPKCVACWARTTKKVPVLDEGQVVGVINRSDITLLHAAVPGQLTTPEEASKLEALREAAALPDDEAMASSI